MPINIQELLTINPSTDPEKCNCNQAGPCWMNTVQTDGSGLNPDGSTNGTGKILTEEDTEITTPSDLNYSGISLLKVYHKEGTQYTYVVEFPKVRTPEGFAKSYELWGSPSPILPQLLLSQEDFVPQEIGNNKMKVEFDVPVPYASTEIQWSFWVQGFPFGNGLGGLVSTKGAHVYNSERDWTIPSNQKIIAPINYPTTPNGNIIDTDYLDFAIQKNRADKMSILQADGEMWDLYLRRWEGIACPYCDHRGSIDEENPDLDYNTHTNCNICFGTGFVGGYYKKIRIMARYNSNPARVIKHTPQGIQTTQQLQSWTLWTPLLRAHDLLVQCSTGDRFYIQDVSRTLFKSYIMDQQFNNALCQRSEIVYHVTDESIDNAFESYYKAKEKPVDTIWG